MSKDHRGYRLQPVPCLFYCDLSLSRMQHSIVYLGNYLSSHVFMGIFKSKETCMNHVFSLVHCE